MRSSIITTFPLLTRLARLSGLMVGPLLIGAPAGAAPPPRPAPKRPSASSPARLAIYPPQVGLSGGGTTQRLLAVATYPDGSQRDVTASAAWSAGEATVASAGRGLVTAVGDGETTLTASMAGTRGTAKVAVENARVPHRWSFGNEIVPIFTKSGCNSGGCHGSPSGRGGFRLSLYGFEPDYDYDQVTKESGGRRVDKKDPLASPLYQKPLMKVAHGGGVRFGENSEFGKRLRAWLAAGAPNEPDFDVRLQKVEIYPPQWTMPARGDRQQVVVVARRYGGSTQDVTAYARYGTNDDQVATVDDEGRINAVGPGETSIIVRYLGAVGVIPVRIPRPAVPAAAFANFAPLNALDEAVLARLKAARVPPADVAGDAEFLRRATLDACGVLPSPEDVRAFLADRSPDRRQKLVDVLLQRPEYVDLWTLRWSDLLRNNPRILQTKGMYAFHRWILDSVAQNKPWDRMARELIAASGSAHRVGPANWYLIAGSAEDRASAASQVFLGLRIECARCHNHPFEAWSQSDYYGFAAFFARVRTKNGPDENERLVFAAPDGEISHPRTRAIVKPRLLGGADLDFAPHEDRRDRLAAWMTAPENPFFARAIGNRLWNHFFGRGVVQPVDDVRLTNPPSNAALLDTLGKSVVRHRFDLKAVIREIMLSRTYQATSQADKRNRADRQLFSHALPRRLPAEVLLDAVNAATETGDRFGPYPPGTRAVQVPDIRVYHGFLAVFGRPQRNVACECERPEDTSLAMALDLINGGTVNSKLAHPQGRVAQLLKSGKPDADVIDELYLACLSRPPTGGETTAAAKLIAQAPNRKEGVEDVLWALLNMKEFLFNH